MAQQTNKGSCEVALVRQGPQRPAVSMHHHLGASTHPVHDCPPPVEREQRLVVGVGRRTIVIGSPWSRYAATSRSSQLILSREYCQKGFRNGVDSTIGRRPGGVW